MPSCKDRKEAIPSVFGVLVSIISESSVKITRLGGRYVFQDWSDGANRSISSEVAERLAELFGIYPADE
jgi:hypothetical protein